MKGERTENVPDGTPNPRKRRRWFWIGAGALVVLGIFLALHHEKQKELETKNAAQAPPASAITVGQSKTGNINIYINALGTVTPIYTVTVFSQITGRVIDVHYKEGELVSAGDPLVDIDPQPFEAMLAQAEGTLEHDQSVLDQARIDLARFQAAWARNAIAKQQLDDQVQAVRQAEGSVKADQGTVAFDKVQLSYCHIVSPITGRVGLRLVDPGNTVFSGNSSTLVVITQLQPITIVFNVSEDDLSQIQTQLSAGRTLKVDAFDRANDQQIETGKLTSFDNQVDTTTGTVKFRGTFPNNKFSLFPNQFVNARLLVRTLRNATLVPTGSVQYNGTNAFVYVVLPNNTVVLQQIKVVTGNEKETAVEGLAAGLVLATSGFDRLENGAAVTVRPQEPEQNAWNAATPP
jgi:multidrug efflux system membrane fusion protein